MLAAETVSIHSTPATLEAFKAKAAASIKTTAADITLTEAVSGMFL
jgi:hypothetical protein